MNFDYTKISAQEAWERDLPLPQIYKFALIGSHGVGNTGFSAFMNQYRGLCFYNTNIYDGKESYISLYNQMVEYIAKKPNGVQWTYLAIRNYVESENSKKFHRLIKIDNALNIVRDPISILKTLINARFFLNPQQRILNLNDKPQEIVTKLVGYWQRAIIGAIGGGGQTSRKTQPYNP